MNNPADQSGLALELDQVGKVYRLYRKPAYRVLDLLGLCPSNQNCYTEYAALSGISISIGRGEKVAIIGRNGAGKSTLLKIITRAIQPSSGSVNVRGKVSALLQIGTGFHPEFTGRQNAYSAMALQGIIGKTAHEKFDEIVDFAELEEYIDQPMKTYSTGMCARLMFSASIVVTPDILVVDEVLGVGDAYFTHKSFARMRQLCAGQGTTLLLVTHDIYSAMNLCDRFVWLDRGKMKVDADSKTVVTAYELSIKEQEEDRLRLRNTATLVKQLDDQTQVWCVRIANRTGFALPAPLMLARIELHSKNGRQAVLDLAVGAANWSLLAEGNLGPAEEFQGRPCRALQSSGSIYHKAEWTVTLPADFQPNEITIDYNYAGKDEVEIRLSRPNQAAELRAYFGAEEGWRTTRLSGGAGSSAWSEGASAAEYGNGLMRIEDVRFTNTDGVSTATVRHGAPLRAEVRFRIVGAIPTRRPTFVMAFHKPGVAYSGYCFTDHLALPDGDNFLLTLEIDSLLLGSGQWLVTVALAVENFYNTPESKVYFAVNDKWYHVIARAFELSVEHHASLDNYAFYVQPARFKVSPTGPRDAMAELAHGITTDD